ncbi:ral guanine nucleotide dissociation stimulator-like 1 isoform X2 [Ruditapes philippinarum]|uniref:ral guanine nucleotide dissociation stimulator-like 1 isoform X2 n=1 Tax=Ruditapes philippinarum TaxID=129788 RepID=UPI00295A8BD6|nr:ral guanine nucleotide dissociation stimulator-like 1 isoform X2 [Ruditapes philippinarum]
MELNRLESQDDVTRFWREEREEGAIYNAYLKKVTYHTLSENEHKGSNEFSHLMWETQKYRVIKAGTLEKLVEYLYIKGEMDSTYTNVFLATYRTFSTIEEVIDILVERYINMKTNKDTKNELQDIQLRTIKSVLSMWIDTYPDDFRDPPSYPCLAKLEKFARQHIPESDLGIRAKHKIDKFRKEDNSKSDSNIEFHFNLVEEVDHLIEAEYHKPLNFCDIPNQTVAEQLTYRDAELFKHVVPHQCLGAVWARRARKQGKGGNVAGSVLATIEQFNRVSLRVIATILKKANLKTSQRVIIVQKWIDIAQEMRHLKNFSSLKAIISGLQANSVYRLRKTWGALPKESLAVFEELSEIFSNENNQLASRNLLMKEATAKFPDVDSANKTLQRRNRMKRQSWIDNGVVQGTVPYLGTFLTDLTMIDTAIPDTTDSLINFEKRRKEFEVLAQIKLLQSASQIYTFREDSQFWSWFDAVRVYDENESYDLSCAIEPAADGGAKLKKKSSSQRPGKADTNRLSLFMCAGLSLDDKSSVASSSNQDSPVSPNAQLSHSSSTSSIQSYDSDNSTPFKSSDACVIKVSLETGATPKSHVYKSIMLHNTDHTKIVIQRILDKYDIKGKEKDYCLLQTLPDGELMIPEKANVFYAMNNNGDYTFVLRTKKEQDALTQSKKRSKRRLKLSLS